MSELKLPRLLAAAKEFNVGQETLIDFLAKKGFNKDELKPTAKLSEPMYFALQAEFQGDKVAKNKADLVEIPKGGSGEGRKKKDEEDLSFRKKDDDRKPVIKEEPKVEAPKVEAPKVQMPAPIIVEAPKVIEAPVAVPAPVIEPEERKIESPAVVEKVKPAVKEPEVEPEIVKIDAPEIEGPKVVGNIDLSAIDSSTRPKKAPKKIEEPKIEQQRPKVEEKKIERRKEPVKEIIITEPVAEEAPKEDVPVVIENIEVEKLSGPKILGKIELPVDNDTRPKPAGRNEQRKRTRIPVDKKTNIQHVDFRQGGAAGAGQTGTGNRIGVQTGGGFNRPGGPNRGGQTGGRPGAPSRSGSAGAGARPGGRTPITVRREDKEIDAKEIQDKIKETQAKLSGGGGRGKSLKAKYRREKRQEAADAADGMVGDDNKLHVTEFVTVSELANLMDVSFTDIISKCMNLGLMVSINQRLDAEVIELVASEFNFEVEFTSIEDVDDDFEEEDNPDDVKSRAPIVTIMGHVDHGKTSLLDYIRSAKVVAGEAGGITQHIGAYEVELAGGKKITFLDTPGHEAFTAMRARGAKVTDIAVIVVAADDAVMPQTKEAISHAQAASVPMIFAVNKIDKDGSNPQKIYEQLSQMNLLVESWGGKYQSQELSAKKGENVDLLLEKILLEAELLDLKANPSKDGNGTIIEASLDKGRGYVATILIQNGTLRQGDLIVSGQYYGRVKAMFNERNQRVTVAPPSTPVVILGLNGAPQAGEKFKVYQDEADAKEVATKRAQISREQGLRARKHITLDEIGRRLALGNFKELNIIIKGDVDGSVEALSDSLQKLSTPEIAIKVVLKAVGQISESDVLLAAASDAILIGFNVRPSSQANKLAENEGVQIKQYSIIYNAIEEIKSAMEGLLEPKIEEKEVATVEIREVYKFDKATVAGSYVTEGKIKRDHKIKVFRDGILVYPRQEGGYAELGSLKRFKDDVKEVNNNYECGLTVKGFTDIQVGDTVVAYEEEEVKRTL